MSDTKDKIWCMGCGVWSVDPCDLEGHISQKYTVSPAAPMKPGETTIAAMYQGRLRHLKVEIP